MERCTGKITDWLIKCGAIPETDRELYEYAIYSILLSLSPMLLALAIGALFGSAVQGVLTITPFCGSSVVDIMLRVQESALLVPVCYWYCVFFFRLLSSVTLSY